MPGRDHFDAQLPKLPCPICLKWKAFEELDEDHAPPRGRQSNLGQSNVVVMTCRGCNGSAGGSYEAAVSGENNLLYTVPAPFCPIHSRTAVTAAGLIVNRDLEARGATDLKAAFLVGIATLGYRWAAAPRLEAIRRVLRGKLSPTLVANNFEFICDHDGHMEPFGVYEVTQPVTCIVVMGVHTGVVLPCATSPRQVSGQLVTDLGHGFRRIAARAHRRPWPPDFTRSRPIEQVWDAGHLFHYDRCTTADHRRFRVDHDELAAVVGLGKAT
jgi:hypothetical protein